MNPPTQPASSLRLLYVEDDRLCALLFEEALKLRGSADVRLAENADEALEQLRDWQPDVVVLDAHLPGIDGYALLELLRREAGLSGVPVFMCSADAQPEDVDRARRAGFAGYWEKPIEVARILGDLDRVLAGTAACAAGR
jgi:CheY-like chemotaxis protein